MAFYIRLILIGLLILWAPFTKADWMNLTGAETAQNIVEIYVLDDHVKIKLEVFIGDLEKFEELIPDEWFKDSAGKRPSQEQRMQAFATRRLQFITGEGVTLQAKLELVEPRQRVDRQSAYAGMINPLTRQRVQDAPADKRVLYAEIIYPFDEKPDLLICHCQHRFCRLPPGRANYRFPLSRTNCNPESRLAGSLVYEIR